MAYRDLQWGWPQSPELIRQMAEAHEGTCLLSFSGGKDAIASWLALRQYGMTRIVPCFYYLVPDLAFVDQTLAVFEDHFDTEILRYPNPNLHTLLLAGTFQPPGRDALTRHADLPKYDYDTLFAAARIDAGLAPAIPTALGVRASDSLNRHTAMKSYGPYNAKRRVFYPIWDWSLEHVREAVRAEGLALPVDYLLFGRSFDGLDARFVCMLRRYFPDDYAKVVHWFPFVEAEILRWSWFYGLTPDTLDAVPWGTPMPTLPADTRRRGRPHAA